MLNTCLSQLFCLIRKKLPNISFYGIKIILHSFYLVVNELDVPPLDGLEVVLLLLQLEDVLHEELLEVLVGEVDAELLEGVGGEVLEAEDVQDADGLAAGGGGGLGLEVLAEHGRVHLRGKEIVFKNY